jgi:transposase
VLIRHYLEQVVARRNWRVGLGKPAHRVPLDRDGAAGSGLDNEAVSYKPRAPIGRKLDPYREIIQERLQAFPRLTAERIFEEIRAAGYASGYTQIKEYVREIRPRSIEEAVRRFETPDHAGLVQGLEIAPSGLPLISVPKVPLAFLGNSSGHS